jgi:hypothetical protein
MPVRSRLVAQDARRRPTRRRYWEETTRIFGEDPWPYGVDSSRPTLEALIRYLHRNGLISREIPIEELFVS